MNALQKALVNAGLATPRKERRKKNRRKAITCNKCGHEMVQVSDTNVIVCTSCGNNYVVQDR